MKSNNPADEIEQKAKEAGVPLTQALARAGIPYSTLTRWRKKKPNTFEIQERILNAINEIAGELSEN